MQRTAAVGVVVLALALASCGGDDDSAIPVGTSTTRPTPVTTAATATTTSTASGADDELVHRYEAFWDARFAANEAPVDPDAPALREYATGAQLDHVVAETKKNKDDGVAFRRPSHSVYKRRVKVLSIDGDTAHLYDCVSNDGIVYRIATGEVIDEEVATKSLDVTMRRVGGAWKLESATLLQRWDGVSGCALAD